MSLDSYFVFVKFKIRNYYDWNVKKINLKKDIWRTYE
jgi:hypothetical protein